MNQIKYELSKLSDKWTESINFANWYNRPPDTECWCIVSKYNGHIYHQYCSDTRESAINDICYNLMETNEVPKYTSNDKVCYPINWKILKKRFACKKIRMRVI
jgi:hypothetical protein